MKKTNKRGFTIVELVIVVAVIAILSAVLIPTFSGIINKANQSADIQAVRNMNVALSTAIEKPTNIIDAAKILSEAGFNTEKGLTPAYKDHSYYWFKPTNQVVYVNEEDGKFELMFPESVEGFPTEKNNDCQSLAVAIAGIVNAPVVSGTTNVEINTSYWTVDAPENTDFDSIIEWTNEKHIFVSNNYESSNKPGIVITGGDIKLTEDVTLGRGGNTEQSFFIVGDTTIDLNGYTLTQEHGTNSGGGYALFMVRPGATLNIIDSSAAQTGTINAVVVVAQVSANATLNIFGGTLKCDAGTANGQESVDRYTIWSLGGTVNMYGGTIDATITDDSITAPSWAIKEYTPNTSKFNLYSGTIIGTLDEENATFNNFGVELK